MKIFLLKNDYKFAELTSLSELAEDINDNFNCKPILNEWGKQKMKWNFEESKIKCDFPLLYGVVPTISERAKKTLFSIIPKNTVEYLPIMVEDEIYYVINVLEFYNQILNINKSKINYFSNGRIMSIDKYVFYENNDLNPIFKVDQLMFNSFVTEEFKNIVKKEGLTGLEFEECEVVTKGWFGNIFK